MLTEDDVPKGTSDETFPHVPGGDLSGLGGADGYGWYEMKPFWRAYRPWLEARGFHLFEPRSDDLRLGSGYIFPPPTQCPTALPYGIHADVELLTSTQITPPPQFAPARDTHMRDVMIKLTKKGSDEHRIYEDLLYCMSYRGRISRAYCHLWAILDSQHDFSFVVMPRWGDYNPIEELDTVGGILTLMRCLLKGLALLHSRRIVHRDIDFHNIMVNYYTFGIYSGRQK